MEQRLPKRSEVSEKLTWRLEDIYETEEAWEADLKKSLDLAEQLGKRAGNAAGGHSLPSRHPYPTTLSGLFQSQN